MELRTLLGAAGLAALLATAAAPASAGPHYAWDNVTLTVLNDDVTLRTRKSPGDNCTPVSERESNCEWRLGKGHRLTLRSDGAPYFFVHDVPGRAAAQVAVVIDGRPQVLSGLRSGDRIAIRVPDGQEQAVAEVVRRNR